MSRIPPRIASLVPSLTELVVSLGLGPQLVARTGYCIHPAAALARVPKVGGTKTVNLAKLQRLAPTHVLVNIDENRRETVEAIRGWPAGTVPEIVVTHPLAPEEHDALIAQVAAPFAGEPEVAANAAALRERIRDELARTQPEGREPVDVLYLIWHDPWMTVARDTYISRMLARVAWRTWPDVEGGAAGAARYPALDGSEPWLGRIERVLLSSEPFAFGEAHVEAAQRLCPKARVERVDGELLSWYGPRVEAGLPYLRRLAGDNERPRLRAADNPAPWKR